MKKYFIAKVLIPSISKTENGKPVFKQIYPPHEEYDLVGTQVIVEKEKIKITGINERKTQRQIWIYFFNEIEDAKTFLQVHRNVQRITAQDAETLGMQLSPAYTGTDQKTGESVSMPSSSFESLARGLVKKHNAIEEINTLE